MDSAEMIGNLREAEVSDATGARVIRWTGGSLDREEAAAFVGPNFDRYWFKWKKMSETGFTLSWNWSSALLGVAWLGSRRMHKQAAVLLIAVAVITFLSGAGAESADSLTPFLLLICLAAFVVLGLFGNKLYRKHACLAVKAGRDAGATPEGQLTRLRMAGGRSVRMGIAWGMVAYFGLVIAFAAGLEIGSTRHLVDHTQNVSTGAQTSRSPNNRYFARARFYNPAIMRMLFEQNVAELKKLPEQTRAPVTLYVIYATDQVEENCGEFLSIASTTARGVARAKMRLAFIGAGISAIMRASDQQSTALRTWFEGIQGIETIETQAKRDVSIFLRDQGSCTDKRVYLLQDGIDLFFRP